MTSGPEGDSNAHVTGVEPGSNYGPQHSADIHKYSGFNQGPDDIHHNIGPGGVSAYEHTHKLTPFNTLVALPVATAQFRGEIFTLLGAPGTNDKMYICLKSAANTYSWVLITSG